MAKKPPVMEKPLPERIANARREGRTQQALELARQYYKLNQNEANRELLRQVTMERGKQVQAQGRPSDAAIIFNNLLTLGGTPEFLAEAAQRLAACGGGAQALQTASALPDPQMRARVLQQAVDAAITQGPKGKATLPTDQHAAFDLILQAFTDYEAGRDDAARNVLQGIGLQSPFLEWKVLLRGLMAYATSDDARAIENWQRLDSNRLPYRLSAALRASIDPTFLKAQTDAAQLSLRNQIAQQQGNATVPILRELRLMLAKDNLAPAFRKAELAVATLKKDHPALVRRLGDCFAWAIINHGQPEDLDRLLRVFGSTPDDPHLERVQALALEARGMWPEAHRAWGDFIRQVAKAPASWPGEIGKRVQALIWARMAENAHPAMQRRSKSGNPFFDMFASQTKPLKPSAEECYRHAIELAPDRLETYLALFHLHVDENQDAKAKKIGNELVKRFPDHAETLEVLGDLSMDSGAFKKAHEYFEKAIQANPLDRALHAKLGQVLQKLGLKYTLDSKPEKARVEFEKAAQLTDGAKTPVLALWAAAEMKAKNPARADELIAQALAEPNQRLACRYALVGASVRAELAHKEKKRIGDDFKAALKETPTPAEILVLIESAAHQREVHEFAFHGQKTQEKTIVKFLDQISFDAFDEAELERLSKGLASLEVKRTWMKCLTFASRKYRTNPFFRLAFVEYYLLDQAREPKTYVAREHLDSARRLIEQMPRGEQQQQYLEKLKDYEKLFAEIAAGQFSMFDALGSIFDKFGPMDDDDDDEDEDW
jgi:tetratricopeptide (TPR) repeat protein